jgi:hypothetical protein
MERILHMDNFSFYSTGAEIRQMYTQLFTTAHSIIDGGGLNGNDSLRITNLQGKIGAPFGAPYSRVVVGVGIKTLDVSDVLAFYDASSAVVHVNVFRLLDGRLEFRHGGTGAVFGATSSTVTSAGYTYIEVDLTIHDTTGALKVWVNGGSSPQINVSNVDTRNGGAAAVMSMLVLGSVTGGSNVGMTLDFVDLYILDPNGVTDPHWGNPYISWLPVTNSGSATEFLPSTGNNYQQVDDPTPDDDSTYVYHNTNDKKDLYRTAAIGVMSGSVKGLAVVTRERKETAGTRNRKHVLRVSGQEGEGTSFAPASTYDFYMSFWNEMPSGGPIDIAWLDGTQEAGHKNVV